MSFCIHLEFSILQLLTTQRGNSRNHKWSTQCWFIPKIYRSSLESNLFCVNFWMKKITLTLSLWSPSIRKGNKFLSLHQIPILFMAVLPIWRCQMIFRSKLEENFMKLFLFGWIGKQLHKAYLSDYVKRGAFIHLSSIFTDQCTIAVALTQFKDKNHKANTYRLFFEHQSSGCWSDSTCLISNHISLLAVLQPWTVTGQPGK